jgi:glutaminyl-peptide cyclotransferase
VLGGAVVFAATQDFFGAAETKRTAPRSQTDRFDAARAWKLIELQLSYGQRPAGSPQLRSLADRLRPLLPHGRFENLGSANPGLRNIVGDLPGRGPPILIAAHYDSQAQPEGFVGANDSAAGTAALIELARALRSPAARGGRAVRFVLFDGEEEPAGQEEDANFANDALRGSRTYVARHRGEKIKELILLDYIANRGLRLPRESSSTRPLWERIRASAARVGVERVFPDTVGEGVILDDHTPFLRARRPAVDLIDFSYRYADSLRDTPDKLSTRSLDAVGETVVDYLRHAQRPLH